MRFVNPVFPRFCGYRFYSQAVPAMDPFQESVMSQKLILVNENDEIVGSNTKEVCHRLKNGKIPLHRAFSVFVFNSNKEILLQQRASCKVTYPNHVTNACCSHPLYSTETIYRDTLMNMALAAQRRLTFELGVPREEAGSQTLNFITKIHYFSEGDGVWGEHEIDYIYVLCKNLTVNPNPVEVKRVWSVPRNEFTDFIKDLEYPLTPWFKFIMKDWLFKIWDNLHDLTVIRDKKIHKYV